MRTASELLESARIHLAGNDPWQAVAVLEELAAWKESSSSITAKNREAFAQQLRLVGALAFQGVEASSGWRQVVLPSGDAYTRSGAAMNESDVRNTLASA